MSDPATLGAAVNPQASGADTESFASLHRMVEAAGLLEPQRGYYVRKIISTMVMLAGGWTIFVALGNSWWQMVAAVVLGFCYTQVALLGHDIGHRQAARTHRGQDLLGWFHGNLLLGFSSGWWVRHHNNHHRYPNHLERDAGITRQRFIAVPEQGPLRRGRIKQFIVRHQHVLFIPLLASEGVGLRLASFKAIKQGKVARPAIEGALLAVNVAAYLAAVCLILPTAKVVAFVIVHQLVFGLYIGWIFAHNHNAMALQRPDQEWDWITRQTTTTRNLRAKWLMHFVYGGLGCHIEHHLFPTMARNNLRHARPIVMRYCRDHGLPYHEVTVSRSILEILGQLRRTTRAYQAAAVVATPG
jgi:fatty acid desaturase